MGTTTHVTFCRICEASCGLLADVDDSVQPASVQLRPDRDHVLSQGFACTKGVRYGELHASPDRLRTPLKRVDGKFVPISWEQALREIGDKLRAIRAEHGADSAGLYIGNPVAFSLPHAVFAGAFARALGTRHVYTSGSQDCNNKFVAAEEMFGSPLLQMIPDIDHAACVILVGTNPAVSQFSFANLPRVTERLKEVERRGGSVFFVNPRRTESARQLGQQVFIRPGSDVFLCLAFAQQLLQGWPVPSQVEPYLDGLATLRELVAPFTPERVAPLTGIEPATLRTMVERYRSADGAVLFAGTGVNQGPHGTLCLWLLNAINVLSGNLDRKGGMLMTRQQLRTARYGAPSGDAIVHKQARVGGLRSVLDSLPAGILPDEITLPGEGQLRALFVTAGNPLLSCANSKRMKEALAQLPLLVSIDLFRNETGNLAHYVLPATSFLERDDLPMGIAGYQPVPYAQYAPALVPALGEARDEWWIFTNLAEAAGLTLFDARPLHRYLVRSACQRLPRWLRFRPALLFALILLGERSSLRALRRAPHGKLLAGHRFGRFLRSRLMNARKKVQLAPARFVAELHKLSLAPLSDKLLLITKRERHSHNSWMHNVPSLSKGAGVTNYLYLHPDDAAARSLSQGAECIVSSSTGSVRLTLRLSDDLMPGTVAVPHGWGHAEADGLPVAARSAGSNVNELAADGPAALEQLAGMAQLTALPVEVRAADAQASS